MTNPAAPFRIAVIPGDGIGREVMPEGLRALDAAAGRFGVRLEYTHIEWASCEYYARTGRMRVGIGSAHARSGWKRIDNRNGQSHRRQDRT
jgi:isocitrate/isopropylmalate dehydrogenase